MTTRLRRLRMTPGLRSLVNETTLEPAQLIYPMFVCDGSKVARPIESMPGIFNFSTDQLVREIETFAGSGLGGILLFGVPEEKDDQGSGSCSDSGAVQQAIRAIKAEFPHLVVITDVCLCEYTTHGHCGLVGTEGEILNDETIEILTRMAISHAEAGADVIAPSDMMDLRVGAIRQALDVSGFKNLPIMSYAVKYASALYGPFREAAQSAPAFGDRLSHQLNPANWREAMREAELDVQEGADILMVKPASFYLDMVTRLQTTYNLPIAAYQVSGEYAMIKAAAEKGWIDHDRIVMESLLSIRRAGADIILSYFAKDIATKLTHQKLK